MIETTATHFVIQNAKSPLHVIASAGRILWLLNMKSNRLSYTHPPARYARDGDGGDVGCSTYTRRL